MDKAIIHSVVHLLSACYVLGTKCQGYQIGPLGAPILVEVWN